MKLKILPNIHVRACRTNSVENYFGFSTKGFPIICSGSSKVRTTKILCQNLEFWWGFFFRCVYRTHRIWKINHLPATFCQAEDGTFYRIQEFYLYIKLFFFLYLLLSCFSYRTWPNLNTSLILFNWFNAFVLLWAQHTIAPTYIAAI